MHMHACTKVPMYIDAHTLLTHAHRSTYAHAHVHAHMHMHTCTCICSCKGMRLIHVPHAHAYLCVCVYVYIDVYCFLHSCGSMPTCVSRPFLGLALLERPQMRRDSDLTLSAESLGW